ncbi:MAG: hypothetical protein DRJ52_09075 [Thermoprotei archaeon]|nr:MAG: hypothetical protein DRJ52_09075 [Thermoprotei archaeon]
MKRLLNISLTLIMIGLLVAAYSIPPKVAEKMIELAETARDQLTLRLNLLNETTVNATILSQVNESLTLGDSLLQAAKDLYSAGNYTKAANLALSAMKLYKEAICLLCDYLENASPKIEKPQKENATKCPGLLVAIERHLAVIQHLRSVLNSLSSKGFNTTEAYNVLGQAESLLLQAKELAASTKNCSEVALLDAKAVSLIGKAMKSVKKDIAEEAREKRMEKVLEKIKAKIESLKRKGSVNETEVEKMKKILEHICNKTKKAKEKAKKALEDATNLIKKAKEKSKKGVEGEKESHVPQQKKDEGRKNSKKGKRKGGKS